MFRLDPRELAEDYSANFHALSNCLGSDWIVKDWRDRSLSWRFFRPIDVDSPTQGWKIHVSAAAVEGPKLLTLVADELIRLRVPFKLPTCVEDIVFLNSGDAGAEQLGKVITVYPSGATKTSEVITRLDQIWPVSQGPEVQTDLHLRPGSAVSFRFGVFRPGVEIVSSTGIHEFGLTASNGYCEPDQRRLDGEQSFLATMAPIKGCPPAPYPIRLNDPVRLGHGEYIALAQLSDTAKTRIFIAADIKALGTVILKMGRRCVAGDLAGRDIRDLLRQEFSTLRALERYPGVSPKALQWHDSDWPVLVMEDLRGDLLCDLPRRERILALPHLAEAVATVHKADFVHGDIKLENAIYTGAKVGLIDFELAARHGESIRCGGTRGYRAPEISTGPLIADCARDVYALGGCLFQAIMDISPGLVPDGVGRLAGLFINEDAKDVAPVITALMDSDPLRRPSATAVAQHLHARIASWRDIKPGKSKPSSKKELRWQKRASCEAAQVSRSFLIPSTQGVCWRNEHFMRSFECEALNIGAAGIVLGLLSVDRALGRSDHDQDIAAGAHWLSQRAAHGKSAGLFTGNAGVALVLATVGKRLRNPSYMAAARERFEVAIADRREIDLFSGVAGVLWTACLLHQILREDWPLQMAQSLVTHLHEHMYSVMDIPVWAVDREKDASYFGCAHGSAGIAMAICYWGRVTGDAACIESGRDTFRRLAQYGRTAQGSALRMGPNENRHHAVGNWCHGVAGYLWAILNGLGDDPGLKEEIDWAVGALADSMSVGTPTYCHGLAGQMELWHMLEVLDRYRVVARNRAAKVARALRLLHVKIDGGCTWPSDDPDIITPDLWIGFLGPATALARHSVGFQSPLLSAHWLNACTQTLESRVLSPISNSTDVYSVA